MDFLGPLPSGVNLLAVIDLYSRYFKMEAMRSITADKLIAKLKPMSARFGLPNSVLTDNGPAFKDRGFNNFLESLDIYHHFLTPYRAQAKGGVERLNRNLMKRLRIAAASWKDWWDEIVTYFASYRVTSHSVTGVPSAELFYGRKVRSKVPDL
jgi:transposase InsO family protein